jgi:hypothetical protein
MSHLRTTEIDQHLNLETFKGKFDVIEFIGAVSEKLITQSKADAARKYNPTEMHRMTQTIKTIAIDPKPFIRTFEAAVGKLLTIRRDVQAKTDQMEKVVRVAEREYSKKMAELNRGFEVKTLLIRFVCR